MLLKSWNTYNRSCEKTVETVTIGQVSLSACSEYHIYSDIHLVIMLLLRMIGQYGYFHGQ